tara:strand:+ start:145 stop:531 length:387 start_codon:yes stop_codon:yes gene_type:complete
MKMKQKVINVSYRKDSNTFEDWMKYEIEILNEDNTKELIPAYGKDLQDALSRVVHDKRAKKIEDKVIKKIPDSGWVIAWFLGMSLVTIGIYYNVTDNYVGFYIIGGMALYVLSTLSITNWFNIKNKDK